MKKEGWFRLLYLTDCPLETEDVVQYQTEYQDFSLNKYYDNHIY